MTTHTADNVADRLLSWYDRHGRKDLPWQHPRTPYRVWVSEIMLQQTQVATAIPYFERFVDALPALADLSAASEDQVLALWSGLGYYNRARNLHLTAKLCMERHDGGLPRDFDQLTALPGIGRSTAGAILAQACGIRMPILDGNVKRVLSRLHAVQGWPGSVPVQNQLWVLAEMHTPSSRVADYTQAIMDLGAKVCTRTKPGCPLCPLQQDCVAEREARVAELPQRKPARNRPTRHTSFLILRDPQGRILLERRPPSGVWARLWSLPEAADAAGALDYSRSFANRVHTTRPLANFVHSFSHYHLAISPLLVEIDSKPSLAADQADRRWVTHVEAYALGLPAPVRKLLTGIEEEM